jgi:hypothetical protein
MADLLLPLAHLAFGVLCLAGVVVLWCLTPWWVALLATLVLGPVGLVAVMTAPLANWRFF